MKTTYTTKYVALSKILNEYHKSLPRPSVRKTCIKPSSHPAAPRLVLSFNPASRELNYTYAADLRASICCLQGSPDSTYIQISSDDHMVILDSGCSIAVTNERMTSLVQYKRSRIPNSMDSLLDSALKALVQYNGTSWTQMARRYSSPYLLSMFLSVVSDSCHHSSLQQTMTHVIHLMNHGSVEAKTVLWSSIMATALTFHMIRRADSHSESGSRLQAVTSFLQQSCQATNQTHCRSTTPSTLPSPCLTQWL